MPFVNVKVIEGVFTLSEKQEMIRRLTDVMVSIEGEAMRGITWVAIEEVKSGEWGICGTPLTTSDVQKLRQTRSADEACAPAGSTTTREPRELVATGSAA